MDLNEGVSALPMAQSNRNYYPSETDCIWLYTEEEFIEYLDKNKEKCI